MILIGSRATTVWHPEHAEFAQNKDWDIVCLPAEASLVLGSKVDESQFSWKYGDVEFHNENFFLNYQLFDRYVTSTWIEVPGLKNWPVLVISSRGLAAIKRSHMYRDFNFTKHMIQYQLLDHAFTEDDHAFIAARRAETMKHFPERKVFGEMTNEEFVQDAVTRHFNHEELHKIITNGNVSYLKLKKDFSRAAYDHELWFQASHEMKISCIQEEAYVIALERFLIPHRIKGQRYPYKMAFFRALEKVCTTLDDGPLREYAVDHWNTAKLFDGAVFDRFFESELWRKYDPAGN